MTKSSDARYYNRVALLSREYAGSCCFKFVTLTQKKSFPITTSIRAQLTLQTFSLARMDSATLRDSSTHFNISGEVMGSSICSSSPTRLGKRMAPAMSLREDN